ncbi:hypothetical protein BTN49_0035 [Candidatus Enterovibrio escicola]|uniref:Uncharacterized protein n=1 Tax=Candidatus Enterovibrio escicola TaxID=1927127 RepID=A0A2A5T7U1_9GAMM|nr:hypothetical protein BTN49_0035 [Candidatus Enterovibrio escacola]
MHNAFHIADKLSPYNIKLTFMLPLTATQALVSGKAIF